MISPDSELGVGPFGYPQPSEGRVMNVKAPDSTVRNEGRPWTIFRRRGGSMARVGGASVKAPKRQSNGMSQLLVGGK